MYAADMLILIIKQKAYQWQACDVVSSELWPAE